jgi:hypothetical protein
VVLVSAQLLDRHQIGVQLEDEGRERVAQRVRSEVVGSDVFGPNLELGGQPPATSLGPAGYGRQDVDRREVDGVVEQGWEWAHAPEDHVTEPDVAHEAQAGQGGRPAGGPVRDGVDDDRGQDGEAQESRPHRDVEEAD